MRSSKILFAGLVLVFGLLAYAGCDENLEPSENITPTLLESEQNYLKQYANDVPAQLRSALQSGKSEEEKKDGIKVILYRNPYLETRMRTPMLRGLQTEFLSKPNLSTSDIEAILTDCMARETLKQRSHIELFVNSNPDAPAVNLEDGSFEKEQLPHLQIYRLKKEIAFHDFLHQIYFGLQKQWRAEMHTPETQLGQKVLVATLSDPTHTTITIFNTFYSMNSALYRASHYIEDKRELLWGDKLFGMPAAGHDLKGPGLKRYIEARDKAVVPAMGKEESSRLAIEAEFLEHIVKPVLEKNGNSVVLAAPTAPIGAIVLEHEIYHAKFFTDQRFADLIRNFWFQNVAEGDRQAWRKALSQYGYDPANEELMYNEFQAYALERDTEIANEDYPDVLAVVTKYIASLKQHLKTKGVNLLE